MHPETLRPLLDARGLLREGSLEPPKRTECFLVFAQRDDARIDSHEWARNAERFFRCKLGLTADKRYDDGPPMVDAAGVVLAPSAPFRDAGGSAVRLVYARPAEAADHDAADEADMRRGFTGLATLARRCRYVYLVREERESSQAPGDDRAALLAATVLASVALGPILAPSGEELFGVKTAREKLGL